MSGEIEHQKSELLCGVIMPISAFDKYDTEHWIEVKHIITQAVSKSNIDFSTKIVSEADDSGIIHKRIIHNLYHNPIVICDVSGKNPNVMFELGLRLAFDKPTIIIKDDKTNYSFDTGIIEHLEYPSDLHYQSIIDFIDNLSQKITNTYNISLESNDYTSFLGHFGEYKIANLKQQEFSSQEILEEIIEMKQDIRYIKQKDNKNNNINNNSDDSRKNLLRRKLHTLANEKGVSLLSLDKKEILDYLRKFPSISSIYGNRWDEIIDVSNRIQAESLPF